MNNVRISDLTASTAWSSGDTMELNNGGTSRSLSLANLFGGAFQKVGSLQFNSTSSPSLSTDTNALDYYSEAEWTPTDASGAGLSFSITARFSVRVGALIYLNAYFSYPATTSTAPAIIGGLPAVASQYHIGNVVITSTAHTNPRLFVETTANNMSFRTANNGTIVNSDLTGSAVILSATYFCQNSS